MDRVEIAGKSFQVERILTRNRTASARLRNGSIVICIPSRWSRKEKEKTADNLLRRAVRAIERGRWRPEDSERLGFSEGQRLSVFGRELVVSMGPAARPGGKVRHGRLEISYVEGHPHSAERANKAAKAAIKEAFLPELEARVRRLNDEHFGSRIGRVRLRDNVSRWGSCSPAGDISLSMRLLFMPERILDYVIVHELAHTRYRSHGKRFWALVGKAVPDHMERRGWLRENGWRYPAPGGKSESPEAPGASPTEGRAKPAPRPGQQKLMDFFEEPY